MNGQLAEAKRIAVEDKVEVNMNAEFSIFNYLRKYEIDTPEARVIRFLSAKNRFFFLSKESQRLSRDIEHSTIMAQNWPVLMELIEDAPFTTVQNLACLVYNVYKNRDKDEAVKVMQRYHELYDMNAVQWPGPIRNACQNMLAKTQIAYCLRQEQAAKATEA